MCLSIAGSSLGLLYAHTHVLLCVCIPNRHLYARGNLDEPDQFFLRIPKGSDRGHLGLVMERWMPGRELSRVIHLQLRYCSDALPREDFHLWILRILRHQWTHLYLNEWRPEDLDYSWQNS